MDWVTETYSSEIEGIAQELVSSQPGLIILETREWILPFGVISVEFMRKGSRRSSIIEEFIMKCIASGVSDLRSKQGIGSLLRLDEVFIEKYLNELLIHYLLIESEVDGKKIYELTDKGWEAYQTGLISALPKNQIVEMILNEQYDLIDICQHSEQLGSTLPVFRYFNQEEQAVRNVSPLLAKEAVHIAEEQLKKIYAGDLSDLIIEMRETYLAQVIKRRFGEIWVFDAVNNQVFCQVWDFGRQRNCEKLTCALNMLEANHRLVQVQQLFNKDSRFLAKSRERLQTLYGPAIRNAFLQACDDVREIMLINSPCIDEMIANEEVLLRFRDIVTRKGLIYIGWGATPARGNQERLPALAVLKKLQKFFDDEDAPGVFLFYIGNSVDYELLVDQQYYMLGTLHWTSYRGEQLVRNMVVDKVCDKSYIVEQSGRLQGMFLKQLELQLVNGYLADEKQCIIWFCALVGLHEYRYIREILAEEALEKVMANHSSRVLLNIMLVYVKAGQYSFGFIRLVEWLVQQEQNAESAQWLETLYNCNPQAYSKITTIYQEISK